MATKNKQQRFDEKFLEKLFEIKQKKSLSLKKDLGWREFSRLVVETPGALDDLERKILNLDNQVTRKLGVKFDGVLR